MHVTFIKRFFSSRHVALHPHSLPLLSCGCFVHVARRALRPALDIYSCNYTIGLLYCLSPTSCDVLQPRLAKVLLPEHEANVAQLQVYLCANA